MYFSEYKGNRWYFYNFFKVVINIDIYQHFRQEEYELIDQLTDKCDQAEQESRRSINAFFRSKRAIYIGSDLWQL